MPYGLGMRLLTIIPIAALALSPCALAQSKPSTLEDRLKPITTDTVTEADCKSEVAGANQSDAVGLIHGGQICAAAKKPLEASFLLLTGQMRANIDILLLPPATQADDRSLMPLYGMLYYGGGLNGVDDDVLHDTQSRARLFELLDRWSPAYSPTYDPGWNARKRPDAKLYETTIKEGKADLRKALDRMVQLDSDDRYFALQREYNAIVARIPETGGLAPETADYKRFNVLKTLMRARGIVLGVDMGPPPPNPDELARNMGAKDSSADFPPPSPGNEEMIVPTSTDPVVGKCTDQAERMAVSAGGAIKRKQVYAGPKWGTVFRADISGGDVGPQRFTCTDSFTGMEPIAVGKVQPLPQ